MKASVALNRLGLAALAGGLLLAFALAGAAEPAVAAGAGKGARAFDLGGGATLVIRRGSVPSGGRIEASHSRRRARRLGSGARGVGTPVRIKVRGGRLRKRARIAFRVPGRRPLRLAGSPRYRVVRYRPHSKRWAPLRTHLDGRRRTASASFAGSARLSLSLLSPARALAERLAGWIVRATGLRGPAADCSARGTPPDWVELYTSNYEHDVLRSCGGSEGDTAVVELVNNRPYGIVLDYGAPVSWGWADGGFGLTQAAFGDRPLSEVMGTDGLYVPPTRRASVGIPKGSWSTATFTARTTTATITFDLLNELLGNGAAYRALGAIDGRCGSELAAAVAGNDGGPRDAADVAAMLRGVLPAVVDCAPVLADAAQVSGPRKAVLKLARRLLTAVEIGRIATIVVDRFGFLDGTRTFTARAKPPSPPKSSDPTPSQPSAPASDPVSKPPSSPSSPAKSVSLSKGASAQGLSGCYSSYCRYMVVKFKNFSSGSHTVKCRENGVSFYTYTRSGASDTSAVCYYGFPGQTVSVTVDGVGSNNVVW